MLHFQATMRRRQLLPLHQGPPFGLLFLGAAILEGVHRKANTLPYPTGLTQVLLQPLPRFPVTVLEHEQPVRSSPLLHLPKH